MKVMFIAYLQVVKALFTDRNITNYSGRNTVDKNG